MIVFNENKSIYLQIADIICDRILSKELKEGERVPSVRETAAEVEVNINTVMRAYEYLQRKNIIEPRRGLGYFVNDGAEAVISQTRRREFLEETLPEIGRKAMMLGLTIEEVVNALKSNETGF